MVIDSLGADDVSFFVVVCLGILCSCAVLFGCEEHVKCAWAQEFNGSQVLFECGHGRYWYLGDRVLAQVQHVYPLETIPSPLCHSIRLADLLATEEIARAQVGHVVSRTPGDYLEFV